MHCLRDALESEQFERLTDVTTGHACKGVAHRSIYGVGIRAVVGMRSICVPQVVIAQLQLLGYDALFLRLGDETTEREGDGVAEPDALHLAVLHDALTTHVGLAL